MLTFGQKFIVYSVLMVLNALFFVIFGLLAIIPLLFSVALVMQLRRL